MTPAYGIKHWWRSCRDQMGGISLRQFARRFLHKGADAEKGTANKWFRGKQQAKGRKA